MMISLVLLIASAIQPGPLAVDTTRVPSVFAPAARVSQDTVRRRPRSIEVSEWYHRRLVVHKVLAYSTIPVFTAQYIAGSKLYDQGSAAPSWVKPVHQAGASTLTGIFTVNTVTGLWNLWDSRKVSDHRWLRASHALMMIGADAAFAYTGIKLSDEAENSLVKRRQHRTVALSAMGLTIGSGVVMQIFNR